MAQLAFHSCTDPHNYSKWDAKINRKDKVWKGTNKNTRVCSNHFILGKPFPNSPCPVMFMKGYEESPPKARAPPKERLNVQVRQTKKRKLIDQTNINPSTDAAGSADNIEGTDILVTSMAPGHVHDHTYLGPGHKQEACQSCSPLVEQLITTIHAQEEHISALEKQLEDQGKAVKNSTCNKPSVSSVASNIRKKYMSMTTSTHSNKKMKFVKKKDNVAKLDINDIKNSSSLITMHTGLQNYDTFRWVFDEVSESLETMQYYKGKTSTNTKKYQKNHTKKPGKQRRLGKENELLLTLMRIKLDMHEDYLAFLFAVTISTVSQIISTWIPLLSRELEGLVYWPEQERIRDAYPSCFTKFDTVRAIIDCTEVTVQKPSMASANSQIFSSYKNRPTAKFLIACTPAGSISFISPPAGGRMSDREITETSGICDMFQPGDICMADRGFTIQDLLLPQGCRLVIPPFTRKGRQFTIREATKTKSVSTLQRRNK